MLRDRGMGTSTGRRGVSSHRHVVFTIDEGLWEVVLLHREKLLKDLMDEAARLVKEHFEKKHKVTPGIIAGLHTFGNFDEMDAGDPAVPPQFRCEECGGGMYPEYYRGVHGYEYRFFPIGRYVLRTLRVRFCGPVDWKTIG